MNCKGENVVKIPFPPDKLTGLMELVVKRPFRLKLWVTGPYLYFILGGVSEFHRILTGNAI